MSKRRTARCANAMRREDLLPGDAEELRKFEHYLAIESSRKAAAEQGAESWAHDALVQVLYPEGL